MQIDSDTKNEIAQAATPGGREGKAFVVVWGAHADDWKGDRAYEGARYLDDWEEALDVYEEADRECRVFRATTSGGTSVLQPLEAWLLRQAASHWEAGHWLLGARDAAGWTQAEAAERAGVSRESWSYWETGAKRPGEQARQKLQALADELDSYFVTCPECGKAMPRSRLVGDERRHPKCR